MAQIGSSVMWENLINVRPKSIREVPPSAESLTPEWLTATLCKNHPNAKVISVSLGAESSGSTNRRAFSVTYNEAGQAAGLPTHLFDKCASGFKTRLMMHQCGTLVNEYEFYAKIRPELDVEIPVVYSARIDRGRWRMALILEDIHHTKNVEIMTPKTKVTRDRIEQMIDILAAVHAKYWDSPRLENEFTWLRTPTEWIRHVEHLIDYKENSIVGIDRAGSAVPASLVNRGDDIYRAFIAAMEVSTQRPHTFLHGDPHVGNYYITRDGRSGLLDWQVSFRGGWGHDFCYTVLSSLDIEDRRNWETDLLKRYLERLKEGGASAPSFDEAWTLYRQQTLYTFVGWLYTIGFGPLQPDMQPSEYCLPVIERSGTAVEDLESLKSLGI